MATEGERGKEGGRGKEEGKRDEKTSAVPGRRWQAKVGRRNE